jgi:hypothetical protein
MQEHTYNQSREATRQDKSPRVTHSQDLKTTIIMLEKVKQVEISFMSKKHEIGVLIFHSKYLTRGNSIKKST